MQIALLTTLLALAGFTPPGVAQDDGGTDPEARVRSVAAELVAAGLELDLDDVQLEVRSRAAASEDVAREFEALFGGEGLETRRQMLSALGARAGEDRAEMLEQLARRRVEALAAYYQPERNALVLVEETLGDLPERELELAHALALAARDQQVDLSLLLTAPAPTLEQRVVQRALVNGEAWTRVTALVAQRAPDDLAASSPRHMEWRLRQLGLGHTATEAWIQGSDLVAHTLLAPDGAARIDAFWSRPPSSEQVLHREKTGRDEPFRPALPDWPEKAGEAELLHEDTLGELATYALLLEAHTHRTKARVATVGWDGDVLRRYRTAEGESVVVWRTVWDRPKDAQQFAREWGAHASGQVRLGGRTVDWVLADSRAVWNKWLKSLEATPAGSAVEHTDARSTERIEQELAASKRSRSYFVANEWRFPKYELTIEVPIGWYEDERDGFKYVVRSKTAGYRDNIYVLTNASGSGQTTADVLEINTRRMAAEELDVETAELRQVAGRELAYLRYRGHAGDHGIVHTSAVFVQGNRQIAITMSVEDRRWDATKNLVDYVFEHLRFGPVPFADAE